MSGITELIPHLQYIAIPYVVTLASTRHVVEHRGLNNLFGVLPRKKLVVHVLPHWLEWLLALIVGFLVMEAVRYWFNYRKYSAWLSGLPPAQATDGGGQPSCDQGRMTAERADAGSVQAAPPTSG